jgi:hypothetical protein
MGLRASQIAKGEIIMRRMFSLALATLALTTTLAALETDNSLGT